MKVRLNRMKLVSVYALAAAFVAAFAAQPVNAQTLNWDPGLLGNSQGYSDGSGTWDSVTNNWWNGSVDSTWVGGDTAQFGSGAGGATPYTVTVNGSQSAGGIIFQNQAYTLSGGTITLSGASPTITSNANATIGSFLTGTAGLTTTGPAMLSFTGSGSYTGTTTLAGGTLSVAGGGSINAGSSLLLQGGALNLSNGTFATASGGTFGVGYDIAGTTGVVTVGSGGVLSIGNSCRTFIGGSNNNNSNAGSGTLSLNAGGLFSVGAAGAFPNDYLYLAGFGGSGVLNLNGGTMNLSRGVDAGGTYAINVQAGGAIIYAQSNVIINRQMISGAPSDGGLTKLGPAILQLNGANGLDTYNGPTVINAGMLLYNFPSGRTTHQIGTLTVNSGGTLSFANNTYYQLGGWTDTTTVPVVVNPGGVIQSSPIGGACICALRNLTLAGGSLNATGGWTQGGNWGVFELFGTMSVTANSSIVSTAGVNNFLSPGGQNGNQTLTISVSSGAALTENLPIANYDGTHVYSITIAGSGSTVFNAANTYTGPTKINGGTLALGPAGTVGSGGVTIASGGVWDVSAYGGVYNFTSGVLTAGRTSSPATDINGSLNVNGAALAWPGSNSTMTLSGSLAMSGGSLNFNSGDLVALPNGALTFSGSDFVVPQLHLSSGSYALFTYNNGAPNTNDLYVTGANYSPSRQTYTFSASGGTVSLTVSGTAGNLFWRSGTWDNGISTSWYNANTASSDKFFTGDSTTFDDSAGTGNGTVTINGAVQPAGLTVSNTAVSYIFSGTGSIVGATSLVMNGPGSLTIGTSNSYSGGTNLNAGLLVLNNSGAIGLGTLTINGGTLDSTTGGITLANNAQSWNGDFAFNGTQSLNMGTGAVSLGSSRTATVSANTLTVNGAISDGGNGYSLTTGGPGKLTLGAANSYSGGTIVNGGTLQLNMGNGGAGRWLRLRSRSTPAGFCA